MRFLIVDDEADLRLILQLNLERWGHEVEVAASAAEAWDVVVTDPPEAMLLDVSMPGETGLELLQRLREADLLPPQVALLSAMVPGDLAREVGADEVQHLAKPFGVAQLEDLIRTMASGG